MQREAVRVQQPDGSFKIIFRENPGNQKDEKNTHESRPAVQESSDSHRQKKQASDPRYYNPMNPGHIDIFGRDLLNRDLVFSLNSGESIKAKMTGYAQYEVLVEFGGKKVILMKQAIAKVEVS